MRKNSKVGWYSRTWMVEALETGFEVPKRSKLYDALPVLYIGVMIVLAWNIGNVLGIANSAFLSWLKAIVYILVLDAHYAFGAYTWRRYRPLSPSFLLLAGTCEALFMPLAIFNILLVPATLVLLFL